MEAFRQAIADAGITPPEHVIADGVIHSFSTNGKTRDMAGRYCLFDDGLAAGWFKDWRTGVEQNWHDNSRKLTDQERRQYAQQMDALKRQRAKDSRQRKIEGMAKAAEIYKTSKPVDNHPYLTKKGVQAYKGVRQSGDRLVIPVRNAEGKLQSLQFINGGKLYLKGASMAGGYFSIRGDDVLCIAEGYSTGASIREATGHSVAVAFDSTNLPRVAKIMRKKFPDRRIIICADDDHLNKENVGMKKATEAAESISAEIIVPEFGDNRADEATDFNDLHALKGLNAVKAVFKPIGFNLMWAKDIKINLNDEYVIKGVLSRGTMSVLYGESNSGKSFFAIDMSMQIATGMMWRGKKTKQGIVLYIAAESPKGVETRVNAFIKHVSKEKNTPLLIIKETVDLLSGGDAERVIQLCSDLEQQHGMPVVMVIFDTLARSMAGGNENAFDDMSRIVCHGDKIRHATNAHVMLVHHTGKDTAKGARGHSSLRAATDTEIEVFSSESNGEKSHTAKVTKQRDHDTGEEFHFSLDQVLVGYDDDGDKITTCVVKEETVGASKKGKKTKLSGFAEIAYDALKNTEKREISGDFMPLSAWKEDFFSRFLTLKGKDPTRHQWRDVQKSLIDKGLVVIDAAAGTVRFP